MHKKLFMMRGRGIVLQNLSNYWNTNDQNGADLKNKDVEIRPSLEVPCVNEVEVNMCSDTVQEISKDCNFEVECNKINAHCLEGSRENVEASTCCDRELEISRNNDLEVEISDTINAHFLEGSCENHEEADMYNDMLQEISEDCDTSLEYNNVLNADIFLQGPYELVNECDVPVLNDDDEELVTGVFSHPNEGECDSVWETHNEENVDAGSSSLPTNRRRSSQSVCTVPSKRSRLIRNSRKEKRNSGQAYVTENGKEIQQKFCHDLLPCRLRCCERFEETQRKKLFSSFWSLGHYDRQADYIRSLIQSKPKSTSRTRTDTNNRTREFTFIYHLKIDGMLQKICKVCFMKTFDLTEGFVKVQQAKVSQNTGGITTADQRGRHYPPNKTSEEMRNEVILHINSFPRYESHYSRRHTGKEYLNPDLNVSTMYSLYQETTDTPVSYTIYRTIFNEMNISFKLPHNDTCNTCDTFKLKLKISVDEEEKSNLETCWKNHKDNADQRYESKSHDKLEAKSNNAMKMITFDLQQVLPTPYLRTSIMFYKRQLAVYNLTVHEGDTGVSYNFLWNETIAGRGANQIGSCLFKYVQQHLSPDVSHLIMYSDTCTGQNRNSHIAAMCFAVLQASPTLKCIDHKFMVSGHFHMECDTVHSMIEKQKKRTSMDIHHPRDWSQLIRSMGKKIRVVDMVREDFLDFKNLYAKEMHIKSKDNDNNKFVWHDLQWMRFSKEEDTCTMLFKLSIEKEEPFKTISFLRRGQKNPSLKPPLQDVEQLPISKEKKSDLISSLHLINPVFHEYYKNLTIKENSRVTADAENE